MEKETKSVEVIQGKKAEGGEADKYEKKEEAKASEVGGRSLSTAYVVCPYCNSIRSIIQSSNTWNRYTCGNCGRDYIA
jgi:transposase-like protein